MVDTSPHPVLKYTSLTPDRSERSDKSRDVGRERVSPRTEGVQWSSGHLVPGSTRPRTRDDGLKDSVETVDMTGTEGPVGVRSVRRVRSFSDRDSPLWDASGLDLSLSFFSPSPEDPSPLMTR